MQITNQSILQINLYNKNEYNNNNSKSKNKNNNNAYASNVNTFSKYWKFNSPNIFKQLN